MSGYERPTARLARTGSRASRSAAKKERQERILAAIQRWPGMKYDAIAKRLAIPVGTLAHDFYELRKAGRLSYRRSAVNEFDVASRRRKVLDLLSRNPRLTNDELARIMKTPRYIINADKRLLTKAGVAPIGVRTRRCSRTPFTSEFLKRVANADSGQSAKTLAMKLGTKDSVIKKARQILALKAWRGLDCDFETDREFRRRQVEYHNNQSVTNKGRNCEGLLGVRLPEEEHKRWMRLHKLKKQGLSWREEGVYRTRGHGVKKTQYAFENVLLIRKRMRERSLVTERQGKGYRFNKEWKS